MPYDTPSPSHDAGSSSIISSQQQEEAFSRAHSSGGRALSQQVSGSLLFHIFVVEFKRNPAALFEGLRNNAALAACRQALAQAGYESELPSGAKVYVKPEHYEPVLKQLRATGVRFKDGSQASFVQLTRSHLIIGEDLKVAFEEALQSVPSKGKERVMKKRSTNPIRVLAPEEEEGKFIVKHTFIFVPIASSSAGRRTASTTDAHPPCGENPRKKRHILDKAAGSSQSLGGVESQHDSQQSLLESLEINS